MVGLKHRFPRYHALLGFFPRDFRNRYREQTLQTLADMLDHAKTPQEKQRVWLRTTLDFPRSLVLENIRTIGGVMAHEMPHYVKRNSLMGGLLLVPFFILVGIASLIPGHMYDTFFWNKVVLAIWLLVLPTLALLLEVATLAQWLRQRRSQKVPLRRALFDMAHTWPMLGVTLLAIGIIGLAFFHDSVHCVAGNPLREIQQWRNAWNCIQQR